MGFLRRKLSARNDIDHRLRRLAYHFAGQSLLPIEKAGMGFFFFISGSFGTLSLTFTHAADVKVAGETICSTRAYCVKESLNSDRSPRGQG